MNGHFVFLDFGFFQIYWFGFLVGCALLIASLLYCLLRKVQGEDASAALLTVLAAIPAAFVLARISYCWFRNASFSDGFSGYLHLDEGGYALHGALAGVLLVLLLRARFCRKKVLPMLDAAVPALASAIAVGRFAGVTAGEETGFEVEASPKLPFVVWSPVDQGNVLWVGFFEGVAALIVAALTLFLFLRKYRAKSKGLQEGCAVLCFMLTYGLSQAVLESMRGDSLFMVTLGFVRIDQIIAILMAVAAIVLISVDYVRLKGISPAAVIKWLLCAAALTVAVVCEFTLNATYMGLIYICMSASLAVIWCIAVSFFSAAVRARADSLPPSAPEREPQKSRAGLSIESMNDSSIESLIRDLNDSVPATRYSR